MATIQIRNVPTEVHRILSSRAAAVGQSLQEYVLAELVDWAGARDLADILTEVEEEKRRHPERFSSVSAMSIIREDRDSH